MTTAINNRVSLLDERRANDYGYTSALIREFNFTIEYTTKEIEKLDKVHDFIEICLKTKGLLHCKKRLEITKQDIKMYKKDFGNISVEDWNMIKKDKRKYNSSIIKKIDNDIKKIENDLEKKYATMRKTYKN